MKLTTCWSREGATLIGGQTCYFRFDGEGETTLTIAKTGDVEAYPVTVVQPEHGTVVAGFPEAPAGCVVFFSVVPDPGWDLYEVRATDSADNALGVDSNADGSTLYARMPAGPLFLEVAFERDYRLVVGENPILFEPGMPDCSFVAPADGPYRFRSTGVLGPKVAILDSGINGLASDRSGDGNGNFDCVAELEAGKTYWINVDYDGPAVEGTIVVSRCAVHSVAVDGGVAHGRVAAVDEDGNPVSEALEGTRIWLEAESDLGYEFGGWAIVDETGAAVPAGLDFNDGAWFFVMPGTNVLVSATFGTQHAIEARSSGASHFDELYVNKDRLYEREAPQGAEIEIYYWTCPGWELSTFDIVAADGADVPHKVLTFYDEPFYCCVVFSMPDADVTVSPRPSRVDCPELRFGENAIEDTGVWNFVAPANGVYSFSFADMDDWYGEIDDDWGWELGYAQNTGTVLAVALAEGEICHLRMDRYDGGPPTVVGGGEISGVIGFGSEPPSGFFRPTLSTRLPPDYGQK